MLAQWLNQQTIQLCPAVENWQQAIERCAQPLLEKNIIRPEYVAAIYQQHQQLGPYYVLAPGVAMPHARPEQGANQLGLSLLLVQQGVNFYSEDNDPVYLIIMLSAPDKDSHIQIIAQLAELFSNETDLPELLQATSVEQIQQIVAKY